MVPVIMELLRTRHVNESPVDTLPGPYHFLDTLMSLGLYVYRIHQYVTS